MTFFLSTLIALNVKWVPLLRKPQPNFQYYVKKVEAQAKEWFPYKKACQIYLVKPRELRELHDNITIMMILESHGF